MAYDLLAASACTCPDLGIHPNVAPKLPTSVVAVVPTAGATARLGNGLNASIARHHRLVVRLLEACIAHVDVAHGIPLTVLVKEHPAFSASTEARTT